MNFREGMVRKKLANVRPSDSSNSKSELFTQREITLNTDRLFSSHSFRDNK